MDATGSDLAGRFDVQETLRSSSVSQSLRARDRGTGTPVTVTVLHSTESSNQIVMADAQSAATMLESTSGAGLVRVLEVTRLDGRLVLVTDDVGGATLTELMSGANRFAPAQVAHFGRSIAAGLASAHGAGVVHGALTPNAVVQGTDGFMRVADFGFARQPIMVADSPTWTAYAAPEQILDGTVDERSDIYSLGSLLYLMLTGHAPFVDFDEELLRSRKLSEAAPAPSHDEPMIPPAFDALVARMLARDPLRRPQSAGEVADDLARFEETVVAAPVSVRTETVVTEVLPAVVPVDDGPSPWWWLALAAVVVAGIITAVLLSRNDAKQVGIPAVVGLPADRGAAELQQRGLAATTVAAASDTYPAGAIVSENPAAGTKVDKGTVVILSVSSGPVALPTTTTQPTTTTSTSTTTTSTTTTTTTTTTVPVTPST